MKEIDRGENDETDFMLWRFEYIWISTEGKRTVSMGDPLDKQIGRAHV